MLLNINDKLHWLAEIYDGQEVELGESRTYHDRLCLDCGSVTAGVSLVPVRNRRHMGLVNGMGRGARKASNRVHAFRFEAAR